MATSVTLETLPQEILEDTFISSTNPNLPLVSRYLLAQLSSAHLRKRLAVSMLLSNDAATQSDLLGRRFLDLALFDAATREITPPCRHNLMKEACPRGFDFPILPGTLLYQSSSEPSVARVEKYLALNSDVPHFMLAKGISISPRLLCHFQVCEGPPNLIEGRFWKIELVRRLLASSANDFFEDYELPFLSAEAKAVAHRGLNEAILVGNKDAVELLTLELDECAWPFVFPDPIFLNLQLSIWTVPKKLLSNTFSSTFLKILPLVMSRRWRSGLMSDEWRIAKPDQWPSEMKKLDLKLNGQIYGLETGFMRCIGKTGARHKRTL
ncbi:MAG: hypothetical protein M1829_000680 [Trizodia sp. TS-e1964]|nr:MAG: hypothetical protein M1829_000680 [Trizodia sp. TS-e1964]